MAVFNFASIIHTSAARDPSLVALVAAEKQISYGELAGRVSQAGNLFLSLGVEPGERVAVLSINDYRFLEIYFGLISIGAVPVPMNAKLGAETLAYVYGNSGSRMLAYHRALAGRAAAVAGLAAVSASLVFGGEEAIPSGELPSLVYDELLPEQGAGLELYPADEDDLCIMPYTSGSTGHPKGCMLTHRGQLWNVSAVVETRGLSQDTRIVISLPLYHKNAMLAIKSVFYSGSSAVILPAPEPEAILQAIETHRCTYMSGVPALYRMLITHLKQAGRTYDLRSLQYAICGSSDTPVELLEDIRHWMGIEVYEGYGLTEGGPGVLETPKGRHKPGSSGLPLPGCRVKIVDEQDQEAPAGTTGELWVNNPGVTKGYWNLPQVTKERITEDGWLKTGDMARQDEDGFVYIVGRKDDMINVGGENVYPKEVENILLKHPHIDDACVLPMPDPVKGAVPIAFAVTRQTVAKEEIKQFFIERGPAYAHPREIFQLSSFPLTGPGKVDRAKLKQMLAQLLQKGEDIKS